MIIDNEFKGLIPPLTDEEYKGLEESILKDGCRDALVLWGEIIVDGHNRYEICTRHNIPFKTVQKEFTSRDDVLLWMIDNQESRRNLTAYARGVLEERRISILQTRAKAKQSAAGGDKKSKEYKKTALCEFTQSDKPKEQPKSEPKIDVKKELAKRIGTGEQTASRILTLNKRIAQAIEEEKPIAGRKPEELKAQLISGDISINEAYQTVKRAEKEATREAKRQENAAKVEKLSSPLEAQGLFQTIVIDPPWDWGDEGDINQFGRAKPDYSTMPIEEIEKLPINQIADKNCHLYLWVTNRSLPKAFRLIEAWGFRYITCLTWVKPYFGMGNYFRGSTEQVLFAVKGSQMLKRKDVGTHFEAARGKGHSAKPDEFYKLVESCSYAPYIDVFGRKGRDNWSVWGENA